MSEPLIDKDMLRGVIRTFCGDCEKQTEAALAYLRSVLTPEALDEKTGWVETPGVQGHYYFPNGGDLHRRIFGEEDR